MAMKLHCENPYTDDRLDYQRAAIESACGLFRGQEVCRTEFTVARDLFALYDGLLERTAALEASRITGAYAPPGSAERATALRDGLDRHAQLKRDLAILRSRADKEKQLNRRVELNTEIKRLEAELAATQKTL